MQKSSPPSSFFFSSCRSSRSKVLTSLGLHTHRDHPRYISRRFEVSNSFFGFGRVSSTDFYLCNDYNFPTPGAPWNYQGRLVTFGWGRQVKKTNVDSHERVGWSKDEGQYLKRRQNEVHPNRSVPFLCSKKNVISYRTWRRSHLSGHQKLGETYNNTKGNIVGPRGRIH